LRAPLAAASAGLAAALLPLAAGLLLPAPQGQPAQPLVPFVTAAAALVAALAFWIVWHADRSRRPAGIVWLAACLLGSAALRFVDAPPGTVSLMALAGLLGAALAPARRHPGRWWRRLLLLVVLVLGALLAALRAAPTAALLLPLAAVATLLAGRRAHQLRTLGPTFLFAAAALALFAQLAFTVPSGPGSSFGLLGHLYEFGAMLLLYRAVLHTTLRQSLQQLGQIADALQAVASPLLVADVEGRIRWVNAALCNATGYCAEQLVGRSSQMLETADEPGRYQALHDATKAGRPWQGQLPVRRADGSSYVDDRRSTPVHNDLGALTGHVWVGEDITERNRAERRLRHSEESLRRLVDSAPDAIIVADGSGRIERANPRVQELLGYAPAELEGMDLKRLMPPAAASQHDRYMQAHGHGHRGMTAAGREVQARRKDGSLVYVHVRVGEMPSLGGLRFVGFLRDMTEHKRAEAALRHSEEKLRKLYDMSPLGIALTDMAGRFLDFNGAFAALCGYDAETLRRVSYWDLTPAEYVEDEQRNLELLRSTGRYGPYEKAYRRPDGRLLPVRLNGVRIELDGQDCIWSIVEDLTERRDAERERERLQRQLMQSQKMEALGQLTGGIAHDFNNMLTGILGLSTLALERHVEDPASKVASYLREIAKVSERGRDLVGRLTRFARPATPQAPLPRPLRPVVEEVMRMLESTLPAQLRVALHAEPVLPEACFVEVDLHQVLTNLVINARDALGGQGVIDIELAPLTATGCECTSCGRRVYGPHVALRVRDHGSGIPPALLLRVFDPFFTTKDVGKGTGLGLAMVHSLVHQAGGHVVVTSEPGHGTTFEVLLPVNAPSPPADPPPTAADACLSGDDGPSPAAALP
jgi:PAS domain S-box-containing protein